MGFDKEHIAQCIWLGTYNRHCMSDQLCDTRIERCHTLPYNYSGRKLPQIAAETFSWSANRHLDREVQDVCAPQ